MAKARVSPLAMSLVKPPENEMLQGMSFREQREYMARHAQHTLSTPANTQASRSECDLESDLGTTDGSRSQEHDELNVVHADTVDVVKPKGSFACFLY